jgi:hypothetical protein
MYGPRTQTYMTMYGQACPCMPMPPYPGIIICRVSNFVNRNLSEFLFPRKHRLRAGDARGSGGIARACATRVRPRVHRASVRAPAYPRGRACARTCAWARPRARSLYAGARRVRRDRSSRCLLEIFPKTSCLTSKLPIGFAYRPTGRNLKRIRVISDN